MPKHCADSDLENLPKQSHDWHIVHSEQADFVLEHGFIPSVTCEYCLREGLECVMDHSRHFSKCALCTCQVRTCCREFHTGKEWDLLHQAKTKIADDLSAADDELELLNPKFKQLQSQMNEIQQKIKVTLVCHSCLHKQQKFLKEHGFKMSDHDTELLWILDEKSSEQSDPPVEEVQQLAATSENPDFNQMLEELNHIALSFWDNPSIEGILALPGGSPSSS